MDIALSTFASLPVSDELETPSESVALAFRARDGDEAAARQLFARLHPLVLKIVRAHLPRRSSADDLVQIAMIKVFTRIDQYAGKVPLEHWVARITVNTCINQLRAERSRPEWRQADLSEEQVAMLDSLGTADPTDTPAHAMAARETVALLLEALSPADRLVVTLYYLEQHSVAEIAALSGAHQVAVRVRLMRARYKMEKILRRLKQEDRP